MKIPHTINANYFKEYAPSKAALELIPDSSRNVKSEHQTWDEFYPPKLTELCVRVIVANFEKNIVLNELPCWDRNLLLETLSTDLPLPLVIKHIGDPIYWKRKVHDRWKGEANYCQDYGFDWKRMYLEKHVQLAVEAMTPEGFDLDNIEALCNLTKDYVFNLNLRELQIKQYNAANPDDEEDEEEQDEFAVIPEPCGHIDLGPIISGLVNLTELHVQFGLRHIGSNYKKSYFQFSVQDCCNLGAGVAKAKNLKLLRVHSCNLDDDRLIALLSKMEGNQSLEAIDFSNCIIRDGGATAVAKFMKNRQKLKSINLSNNKIEENGISAIAFVLTQSYSSPIEYLNLRYNAFGNEGLKYLASALVRERQLIRTLNLSCCDLERESGIFLGEVLNRNSVLLDLDLSNNQLEEEGGRALEVALQNNRTIQYLDLRMTEVAEEDLLNINQALHFNRIRAVKGEKGVEKEMKLIQRRAEEAERARLAQMALEAARAAEEEARLAEAMAKAKSEPED